MQVLSANQLATMKKIGAWLRLQKIRREKKKHYYASLGR